MGSSQEFEVLVGGKKTIVVVCRKMLGFCKNVLVICKGLDHGNVMNMPGAMKKVLVDTEN